MASSGELKEERADTVLDARGEAKESPLELYGLLPCWGLRGSPPLSARATGEVTAVRAVFESVDNLDGVGDINRPDDFATEYGDNNDGDDDGDNDDDDDEEVVVDRSLRLAEVLPRRIRPARNSSAWAVACSSS